MVRNIPENIGDYVYYDTSSSSFLRWKIKSSFRTNIGDMAGSLDKSRGYYRIMINGKSYKNHRIVFFLHHGYCPKVLDHIDGRTENNNINNIREATTEQNNQNAKVRKDNSCGVKGIYTHRRKKYPDIEYWVLKINKNKKTAFRQEYRKDKYSLEQVTKIIEEKRVEIHGDFANNG